MIESSLGDGRFCAYAVKLCQRVDHRYVTTFPKRLYVLCPL